MTTLLEALPTGTVVADKSGQRWKLEALQTRDSQGVLYEGALSTGGRGWVRRSISEAGQGAGPPF